LAVELPVARCLVSIQANINIHQQVAHPQLSQCSWRVTIIRLVPELHTINLIANPKNVLNIAIAMLNCLTDSLHSLVA
jgi:hypothetical protein